MTASASTPRPPRSEQLPPADEVIEVAPNVLLAQLPLALPGLGHVNSYLLTDGDGVAVVDPGLADAQSWEVLLTRLRQAGYAPHHVHTIVITHSHPDHYGNALRLRDEAGGARLVGHESFGWFDDDGVDEFADPDDTTSDAAPYWERHPFTPWGTRREPPPAAMVAAVGADDALRRGTVPPRLSDKIADGAEIELARRRWVAVHTPGHTQDHLCLYDPTEGLMLSGDHVLPTITPHVGGRSVGDDAIGWFMDSLQGMHRFADVSVVLPAHGDRFSDLGGRADAICAHHDERLDELLRLARQRDAGTVVDFMQAIFRERSWGYLAERETFAHLEHLRLRGDLEAFEHDGLLVYRAVENLPEIAAD